MNESTVLRFDGGRAARDVGSWDVSEVMASN